MRKRRAISGLMVCPARAISMALSGTHPGIPPQNAPRQNDSARGDGYGIINEMPSHSGISTPACSGAVRCALRAASVFGIRKPLFSIKKPHLSTAEKSRIRRCGKTAGRCRQRELPDVSLRIHGSPSPLATVPFLFTIMRSTRFFFKRASRKNIGRLLPEYCVDCRKCAKMPAYSKKQHFL